MGNLVLINKEGLVAKKFSCQTMLPPGYEMPEGYILSWEDQPVATGIWNESSNYRAPNIIHHGKATAHLRFLSPTVVIRIESTDIEDLFELRDVLTLFIGGKVIGEIKTPSENPPSFIAGLKGDCKRLKNYLSAAFTSAKQRFGMKLASL